MGAVAELSDNEWGECLVPSVEVSPAMTAEVRRIVGAVPDWLTRVAPCPWLVDALCTGISRPIAYAPIALFDLVALVVSQDNSCRYCYGIQRTIMRILGHRDDDIDRLLRDFHTADLPPAERAALEYARRISRANPLPGRAEFQEVVDAGLAPLAVAEIAAGVASSNFANRVATMLALPPESLEAAARRPMFRLMRPLMAWRMRPRQKSPRPPPEPNDGPCARLIAALGDSPTAHALRRTIDGALASDILPRRTKILILAVVARAIGCAYVEEEARALLAREGISGDDLAEILATLASPHLDERERRLVPFARETVRYQPAAIQARLREASEGFTPEQTLETVGITSLANAVCRLSVVLDACAPSPPR